MWRDSRLLSPADGGIPPPRLKQGDTVGIVAPAGVVHRDSLQQGIVLLENRGFNVRVGHHAWGRSTLFAGDDRERAGDVLRMLHDPDVRALFCARGGYGSQRLLPQLASELRGTAPKIFVGYSDITALHALLTRHGWVTFHGPMPDDWARMDDGGRSVAALLSLLTASTTDLLPLPSDMNWEVWHAGKTAGRLVGGNLSLLAALLGTPYSVNTDEAILFIEDVGEAPYRIDRMLSSLQLAGKLRAVKGVILGDFTNCHPPPGGPPVTVDDVLATYFGELGIPVVKGYPAGHGRLNLPLPLGAMVQLDTSRRGIRLLSPAVI